MAETEWSDDVPSEAGTYGLRLRVGESPPDTAVRIQVRAFPDGVLYIKSGDDEFTRIPPGPISRQGGVVEFIGPQS